LNPKVAMLLAIRRTCLTLCRRAFFGSGFNFSTEWYWIANARSERGLDFGLARMLVSPDQILSPIAGVWRNKPRGSAVV
jgi:hypothetical protein